MPDYLTHIPHREEGRPVQRPSNLETHERAEVRVELDGQRNLIITVDTPTGFISTPQIVLQRANGTRTPAGATYATEDENGKTIYLTTFDIEERYIDGIIDVRGKAASGMVASAVEGFVLVCYKEPGTYEFFAPRGAAAVRAMVEDKAGPFYGWIGPAPLGILERAEDLTAASAAFTVDSSNCDDFTVPLRLAIRARLGNLDLEGSCGEPDVAIYRWDNENDAWSRLEDSSALNPVGSLVEVDIEQGGIYAVFARERRMRADDLRRENSDLRRLIVDQDRELRALRARLEQESRARLYDKASLVQRGSADSLLPRAPTDDDPGGW